LKYHINGIIQKIEKYTGRSKLHVLDLNGSGLTWYNNGLVEHVLNDEARIFGREGREGLIRDRLDVERLEDGSREEKVHLASDRISKTSSFTFYNNLSRLNICF